MEKGYNPKATSPRPRDGDHKAKMDSQLIEARSEGLETLELIYNALSILGWLRSVVGWSALHML